MTTAVDLLTLALKDIGALGIGQSIGPDDTADGLATLNMMLGEWQAERLSVYHLVDTAIPSTGAQSYTVGSGGNFNIQRPVRIEAAYARLNAGSQSAIDYPVKLIDAREDYANIALKGLTSFPKWAFYDASYPMGNLLYYPVPNASFELHIVTMEVLPQFSAPGATISLPPQYVSAIRYNLGPYLAPSYQIEPLPSLVRRAANAKRIIKRMNAQIQAMKMPRGLRSYQKWNIYSGNPY
ncbi:packaged DNA stabilization gp4 family protein [Ralstonia chuxiongensis]|uniref:Packaged DNA stabilization gp4 family protein n=1 Tax=Ralstonia chuxiongensis TaxID=2957504 RepID=A0AA41WRB6_9RALS|nr:packaged DNA stabilization gp4 family protein [Ralstonia chuxiongensis]MCP1173793.1 packaged DNA stabilization gp4 family protein [Ralstonia chuxiongensis]